MNENTTAIIDDLCALNWIEVLKLPEKKDVNYTALQEEFCAVNFTAILPELYEEFDIQAVIDKVWIKTWRVFAGHEGHFVGFVMRRLNFSLILPVSYAVVNV